MIDLSNRSILPELLDGADIPFADIRQNMKELNTINTWLGGHRITIAGLKAIIGNHPAGRPLHICEIGCGGGDNLFALHQWCRRKKSMPVLPVLILKQNALPLPVSNTPC